jgi:trans-feruloyl-CoA hydratase/vanillin synthase
LVNEAVPASQHRQRTTELARSLLKKNPTVLRQARMAYKYAREMSWEQAAEYLTAKVDQTNFVDPEKAKEQGLQQFLDQKSFRPGHGSYER